MLSLLWLLWRLRLCGERLADVLRRALALDWRELPLDWRPREERVASDPLDDRPLLDDARPPLEDERPLDARDELEPLDAPAPLDEDRFDVFARLEVR